MVVERFLKNRPSDHLRCKTFGLLNDTGNCRGDPRSPGSRIDHQQQVKMVRHDHIFFQTNIRVTLRYTQDCLFHMVSSRRQSDVCRNFLCSSNNGCKQASPFVCTYCDKVCPILAVIVIQQPVFLSSQIFHRLSLYGICRRGEPRSPAAPKERYKLPQSGSRATEGRPYSFSVLTLDDVQINPSASSTQKPPFRRSGCFGVGGVALDPVVVDRVGFGEV